MEFELQRFADEEEQSAEPSSESEQTEEKPLPEELNGLPEEIARETLAEWEKMQAEPESEVKAEPETEPAPVEEKISREDYQAKVSEVEQLKAQLAQYQRQQQSAQQEEPPTPKPQQPQPPQMKLTPEISKKITEAIEAEAINMTGFSADDLESLQYADDDDPRLAQWNQAKRIAENNVYTAIGRAREYRRQQEQNFYNEHMAAVNIYNEFAQKEFAEPDFQAIQKFATNEFFEQLPPSEQTILAESYLRVERQTASPAEMLVVKNYYERAKSAYRARGAKAKPATNQPKVQLPRTDQLKGASSTSDGQLSARDIEKMLEGDFTKLTPKQQRMLLGLS